MQCTKNMEPVNKQVSVGEYHIIIVYLKGVGLQDKMYDH